MGVEEIPLNLREDLREIRAKACCLGLSTQKRLEQGHAISGNASSSFLSRNSRNKMNKMLLFIALGTDHTIQIETPQA